MATRSVSTISRYSDLSAYSPISLGSDFMSTGGGSILGGAAGSILTQIGTEVVIPKIVDILKGTGINLPSLPGTSIPAIPTYNVRVGRSGKRMNVLNPKALRRSMRRVQGFAKFARKTISFTQRVKMKKRCKR